MYQEIEMGAPYVNAHCDTSTAHDYVKLHTHIFYEILFCQCDNLQYVLGANRYHIKRGDVVYIPPNVTHMPILNELESGQYARYVMWLSPAFATLIKTMFPDTDLLPSSPFVLRPDEGTAGLLVGQINSGIEENARKEAGWEASLVSCAITLLTNMLRVRSSVDVLSLPSDEEGSLNPILRYIEDHMAEDISLQTASDTLLISENRIKQMLRTRLNTTFHKLLVQRRLIASKTLLQKGVNAEAACTAVGFRDYSAFYRAFKREYSISPSQYRRYMAP